MTADSPNSLVHENENISKEFQFRIPNQLHALTIQYKQLSMLDNASSYNTITVRS